MEQFAQFSQIWARGSQPIVHIVTIHSVLTQSYAPCYDHGNQKMNECSKYGTILNLPR